MDSAEVDRPPVVLVATLTAVAVTCLGGGVVGLGALIYWLV